MILVLENSVINMDNVVTIDVIGKYDDGTLKIEICTTGIVEWQVHNPGVGPGFSPLEMKFRIKEKNWGAFIKALQNNDKVFIFE